MKIGRRTIEITHPEKVLFPEDGYTKQDVIDYYRDVAPAMLPYLRGRAVNFQRFPDGIAGLGFYQKRPSDHFPAWIHRVTLPMEQGGPIEQVVCDDASTLVYLANQNALAFHPWLSKADRPDNPDQMVFDLDPSDNDFGLVRRTALWVRDLLGDLDLSAFVKTTGSRGLHVVTPLDGSADFDTVRAFAQNLGGLMTRRHRELTAEVRIEARKGRLFLDTARNAYGQNAVAPYSLRARPGAPVAAPLDWSEVEDERLSPQAFTLKNIRARLDAKGDLWEGMNKRATSLQTAMKSLARMGEKKAA